MTLLGVSAANTAGVVVNRSCGSGYIIACEEAKVTTDSGQTFVFGADRRHYDDITDSWPPNADNVFGRLSGHATADFEMQRLPVMSSKYAGATWAQVGAAASGTIYNNIVTRGNAIKTWQDSHIGQGRFGCTFAWTFHHEPNNDSGGAGMLVTDWQAAIQNIVTIWQGLGVRFWNGTTVPEGIILSINLISGETSGGYEDDWDTWWPPGHTWLNANMICAAGDGYNNGAVMKPLSYIFQTFKSWTDAKRTSQAAAGKMFLAAIWETGCQANSFYTTSHATWTATGLAPTKFNWFQNMADYIQTSWPLLHHLCYWDSTVTMIWTIDTTQNDWDGFVAISQNAAWGATGIVWDSTDVVWDDPVATWDGGGVLTVLPAFQNDAFQTDTFQSEPLNVVSAVIAQTMPGFTQTASALAAYLAEIAQELGAFTQSADATVSVPASASQTLGAFTQSGTVDMLVRGIIGSRVTTFQEDAFQEDAFQTAPDVAHIMPAFTQLLVGSIVPHDTVGGRIDQVVPGFTQAADATLEITVVIAQSIPAFTQAAAIYLNPTGAITQTAPAFAQAALGLITTTAVGDIEQTMPMFTQSLRAELIRWDEWPVGSGDEWLVGSGEEWLVRQP